MTLPGGKALSEGECSNSKSILTEFHLLNRPKYHLQFKVCFPLKVIGGHALRDSWPASPSHHKLYWKHRDSREQLSCNMFTDDSSATTKRTVLGCLRGSLISKLYKCKHWVSAELFSKVRLLARSLPHILYFNLKVKVFSCNCPRILYLILPPLECFSQAPYVSSTKDMV